MQLTLDDLRKASDPLALLLGADDEALDMIAAIIQGWHQRGVNWVRSDDTQELILLYSPTSDLGQAYALIGTTGLNINRLWSHDRRDYSLWLSQYGGIATGIRIYCESQAGSHARAVVVLAILGLLLQSGKDGGE